MANLENNNDKEKKTVTENLTEKVQEMMRKENNPIEIDKAIIYKAK